MNERDRANVYLGIFLVAPLLCWAIAVKQTIVWPDNPNKKKIAPIVWNLQVAKHLVVTTPQRPVLLASGIGGVVLAGVVTWLFSLVGRSEFGGAPYKRFVRGTKMVSAAALARMTKSKERQVTIAGVPIPIGLEAQHFLLCGSTGSGKSQALLELATGAMRRRAHGGADRIIVADPGGDMLSKFYREGDAILNPFDARTVGWSLFNEIRSEYDLARYAVSVIPRGAHEEAERWDAYARLMLASCMKKLAMIGNPSMYEVYRWVSEKSDEDLEVFLRGTQAEGMFLSNAGKALASTRFILSEKIARHLDMPDGEFSIRDWLENGKGNLYITWRQDMAESLRPLISCWIDVIANSVLSLPPSRARCLWLLLDELASLGVLSSLPDALTQGRKYGIRVAAGLQSVAQLNEIYGKDRAQTMRACFRSLFVLGAARTDPLTSEDMSQSLSEHEVVREHDSHSYGKSNSRTRSGREVRERVVMPSEITSLEPRTGFLALAEGPMAKVTVDVQNFTQRIPPFVDRMS